VNAGFTWMTVRKPRVIAERQLESRQEKLLYNGDIIKGFMTAPFGKALWPSLYSIASFIPFMIVI
jgi:hypothetical protein